MLIAACTISNSFVGRPLEHAAQLPVRAPAASDARPAGPITSRSAGNLVGERVDAALPRREERRHLLESACASARSTGGARIHDEQRERAERSEDRRGERDASRARCVRRSNPVGDRAEVERDQHAEHQQHKNLSDGLEQPDTKDCQDRRCQDRREPEAPARGASAFNGSSSRSRFLDLGVDRLLHRAGRRRALSCPAIRQAACPSSA